MKFTAIAATTILATASFATFAADAPPAASAPAAVKLNSSDTPLGDLLDNAAAKAVLMKYIATMIQNEQINMARGMTLKALQAYAADQLTDETLGKIDAELAQLK